MSPQLQAELEILFGKATVGRARRLDPGDVDVLAVGEAADALALLAGRPDDQVALVRALPADTAAGLCRWLSDPGFWIRVADITRH